MYVNSLLDKMLGHVRRLPFIHLGGEKHSKSKISCPRTQSIVPGLEPGPLDPETSALTMKPPTLLPLTKLQKKKKQKQKQNNTKNFLRVLHKS